MAYAGRSGQSDDFKREELIRKIEQSVSSIIIRPLTMKKIPQIMLMLLFMGATATKAQSTQQDMDDKYATELVKAGTAAPDFKMKTPDGKTIQLSKYARGKTVVLDVWASWCPDCRKDAPEVVRLYEKYHQYGIEFIGISMDTDVEAWRKAIEKFGITEGLRCEVDSFDVCGRT